MGKFECYSTELINSLKLCTLKTRGCNRLIKKFQKMRLFLFFMVIYSAAVPPDDTTPNPQPITKSSSKTAFQKVKEWLTPSRVFASIGMATTLWYIFSKIRINF